MTDIKIVDLPSKEWNLILPLTVANNQQGYIETAEQCLHEARTNSYGMEWTITGVYTGDTLCGFAMHGEYHDKEDKTVQVWLDRFMIDGKFQGMGIGRRSFALLLSKLFDRYSCDKIYLSVKEENVVAVNIYKTYGFVNTPDYDHKGDRIMTLTYSDYEKVCDIVT